MGLVYLCCGYTSTLIAVGYSSTPAFLPTFWELKVQSSNLPMNPEQKQSLKEILKVAIPILAFILLIYLAALINEKHDPKPKVTTVDTSTIGNSSDTTVNSPDTSALFEQNQEIISRIELGRGTERVKIKDAFDNLASVDGSVEWTYDNFPSKYKDNPDLFIAHCHAVQIDNEKKKTYDLKLLINRNTERFKVLEAREDGKKIEPILLYITLGVEGGVSTSTDN